MYEYYVAKKNDEHARTGRVKDVLGYLQKLQRVCAHPQLAAQHDPKLEKFLPRMETVNTGGRRAQQGHSRAIAESVGSLRAFRPKVGVQRQ